MSDFRIHAILRDTSRIAVVGASNKPDRPSYGVIATLVAHGYDVTPVNPGLAGQQIHGQTVVASLADAGALDMVDIFRAADAVAPIVEEAIRLGAKTIWMQLGIINEDAAAKARAAGMQVVMDRCPKIELSKQAGLF